MFRALKYGSSVSNSSSCCLCIWFRRQCRRAVGRHWDNVAELSGGTEAVRMDLTPKLHLLWWLTCNSYSNRISPVLRPVLAASTAKPSDTKERSMRALVQQYSRRFLKNGSLRRGQADQRRGTLEQLVLPILTSAWCPKRDQGHQQLREMHCALGKRKGIWCLVWSFGNALC